MGDVKGFWRVSGSPIMHLVASLQRLRDAGYPTLMGSYLEWHPKKEPPYEEAHVRWCERSVNMKVGDKHL